MSSISTFDINLVSVIIRLFITLLCLCTEGRKGKEPQASVKIPEASEASFIDFSTQTSSHASTAAPGHRSQRKRLLQAKSESEEDDSDPVPKKKSKIASRGKPAPDVITLSSDEEEAGQAAASMARSLPSSRSQTSAERSTGRVPVAGGRKKLIQVDSDSEEGGTGFKGFGGGERTASRRR